MEMFMFFIITTGRSGSQSLAQLLDQHPFCRCLHEPHPLLIKLAWERCHGVISDAEIRNILSGYMLSQMFPHRIGLQLYGESDQKLSYFIDILNEIGTVVRFVWLVRDGRDVVASAFARGWYSDNESANLPNLWVKYRIRGDLTGDVEKVVWDQMSAFERCCWYWSYTNRQIENQLASLDGKKWLRIRLEEYDKEIADLLEFLSLPYYPLKHVHVNRSVTQTIGYPQWSAEQHKTFEAICGREMNLLYPSWQDRYPWREQAIDLGTPDLGATNYVKTASSHIAWFVSKSLNRLSSRKTACADPNLQHHSAIS
jgi:hypothetical protein